ncbi:MAG: Dps family protein [Elusimicrobiota bacterium]
MKPNIAINENSRKKTSAVLNSLLSDEYLLYTKTRNFHWNVTGPQFSDLHKFFEDQYEELDGIIDETAERARALGETALGSMAEFLKNSRLKERTGVSPEAAKMIAELLGDHESVIRSLRADLEIAARLGDMGTSDFLTGLMERHEKMAWMLRAFNAAAGEALGRERV